MNLILFGFKSCGKTYFGKRLSILLKRPFIDTDQLILQSFGEQTAKNKSLRILHQTVGEAAFRALENQQIQKLNPKEPSIIALGGGAILNPANRAHLQNLGRFIFLNPSFDTILKRILAKGIPSFADPKDPAGSLRKIYDERLPVYESIPAQRIRTDTLDEETILNAIIQETGAPHGV